VGDTPPFFVKRKSEKVKVLNIFADESGVYGPYEKHSPYYIVTLVFHSLVRRVVISPIEPTLLRGAMFIGPAPINYIILSERQTFKGLFIFPNSTYSQHPQLFLSLQTASLWKDPREAVFAIGFALYR